MGGRIGAREVDDVAIARDDGGDIDLRHAARLVAQHVVDLVGPHLAAQLVVVGDIGFLDPVGDALQHQVGGFHRLVGRLGQRNRHVGEVDLPFLEHRLARLPRHQDRSDRREHDHQQPGQNHRPAAPAQLQSSRRSRGMGGWVRHDEASQQGDHTPGLQIRRHTKGPYIWAIVRVVPRCWGMPARSVAKCKCPMRLPWRDLHFAEMPARSRRRVAIRAVMPPRKSDSRHDGSFGTGDVSRDTARRMFGCQFMTPASRCQAMAAGGSSRDGRCRRAHCLRL